MIRKAELLESLGSESAIFRDFAEYWRSLPSHELIPFRRDFRPEALERIVPSIVIHDLVSPDMVRLRLVGTEVVKDHRREITGKNYLELVEPDRRALVFAALKMICEHPCGIVTGLDATTQRGRALVRRTFGLPMRNDDGFANLIYFCSLPSKEREPFEDYSDPISLISVSGRRFLDIGAGVPDFDDYPEIS
jgi:hypothetical protein